MNENNEMAQITQLEQPKVTKRVENIAILNNTLMACQVFGAYAVRKAARAQMDGDKAALATVGLAENFSETQLQEISTFAFSRMTHEEYYHEFCLDYNLEFNRMLFGLKE